MNRESHGFKPWEDVNERLWTTLRGPADWPGLSNIGPITAMFGQHSR